MTLSLAAVIFEKTAFDERAVSHAFAVAIAGYDVPAPTLTLVELEHGLIAALYSTGAKGGDELEHASELFEEDLSPGLYLRETAESEDAVVYALVYSDAVTLDDAYRFGSDGVERHFLREGEEGTEAGIETLEEADAQVLSFAGDDQETQMRPHRGSTWLSSLLGFSVVSALARAVFEGGRSVPVRLFAADAETIAAETALLVAALKRTPGRGTFALPDRVAGVPTPAAVSRFVAVYDYADPSDPKDLYRELSIGAIDGTLHFLRRAELESFDGHSAWALVAARGAFPIAMLTSGALGGGGKPASTIALASDGDRLIVVDAEGRTSEAGPTFAELLRYLALGWKERSETEDELIDALMLRALVRVGGIA